MKLTIRLWALAASISLCALQAMAQAPQHLLNVAESDPVTLGWMVGSPPPVDKQIHFADGSIYRFPQIRWSLAHLRRFMPTVNISRGDGPVSALPRDERQDIDAIEFHPLNSSATMTWAQSLEANYTDAIIVLHRGRVVYERYFGVMKPDQPHMAMSMTKSFIGTLAAMLIAENKLDPAALVTRYIPEMKDTAYADATIREVMDMTVGVKYSENYADRKSEIYDHMRSGGVIPRPPDYSGPQGFQAFLLTLKKEGEHGQTFAYKTVNADILGWLLARASGQSLSSLLSERIWRRLGAGNDAYMLIDSTGFEFAGGGLNLTLRDLARFGEMMRLNGRFNGQQIVPEAAIDDIRKGGSQLAFAKAGYGTLPDWSYRDMWWISNNGDGAYSARGVYGQALYIDPKAEMVIARFASNRLAANANNDPTSLPAYEALAQYLIRCPQSKCTEPR